MTTPASVGCRQMLAVDPVSKWSVAQVGCIVSQSRLSDKTNHKQESHEKDLGRTVAIFQ